MKKQLLSSAIALAIAAPAQAAVLVGNYGASTTLGQVASPTTINSVRFNPAAGYLALDTKNGENVRFGYLSQLGGSVEFGQADDFVDQVDTLMDDLDNFDQKLTNTQNLINAVNNNDVALAQSLLNQPTFANSSDVTQITEQDTLNNAVASANTVIGSANNVLNSFGENGRVKTSFNASIPGMPVVFELPKVPGVLSLDASVGFVSLAGFEADEFAQITAATDLNNLDSQFTTDSQMVVRGGTVAQFALGYSQPISAIRQIGPMEGELIVGAKANMYVASLTSSKVKIYRDQNDDREVSDLIEDAIDQSEDSTAFGLDVGAVWAAKNYQFGLTVKNLNSPEFDAYASDEAAGTSGMTTIKLDPQTTLDAATFMENRTLMLTASADLNKVDDLVGDEVQMMHVSASYFPSNFLIPTVRVGYEKNLAGEELSAVNFGLGLFRGMTNLDVTYGLDTASVDGEDLPRRLGFQLSFEETF